MIKLRWIGLLLALLAVTVAGAGPALAAPTASPAAGPEVNWWLLGAGGGNSGGGAITLNDSLGQPVIGNASGSGVAMNGGFWQAPAAPAAVPGLRGSRVSGIVHLNWTAVTADIYGQPLGEVIYRVYRAVDTPYFTLGGPPYAEVAAGTTYTDPDASVLGNAAHATYYAVTAVSGALESSPPVGRTGARAFPLVPGN